MRSSRWPGHVVVDLVVLDVERARRPLRELDPRVERVEAQSASGGSPTASCDGLDAWAIRTSGLSGVGGGGRRARSPLRSGSVPHARKRRPQRRAAPARHATRMPSRDRGRENAGPMLHWHCTGDRHDALVALRLARPYALRWPARAALDIGDAAPDFTTPAALGGKVYQYSLADSLKKGPVVLYFFPAAYLRGLLDRGAPVRRGDPAVRRRSARRWSACPATTSTRCPSSRCRRARASFPVASDADAGRDEVLRRRAEDAARNTPTASRT